MPLIVNTPQPFEASPGLVRGVAPAGTHHVTLYAHGRQIARTWLHEGQRRFLIAPRGLPAGDQTIDVAAYSRKGRRLGQARVANVYGLPAAAFTLRPATTTDGAVQRALSGLRSQPGATDGVWAVDLRTGQTVAFLRFEDAVQEIFEVTVLPGMCYPELQEPEGELLGSTYFLSEEALAEVAGR